MLRTFGIVGGISVATSLLLFPNAALAQEPEPGVVPAPEPAEPEPAPEPEPEPEPAASAEFSASSSAPPASTASISSTAGDDGIRGFKGRFGMGAIRTIAGLNGINFRYFITDRFALGANVGVALFSFKENEPGGTDVCPGPDCDFENNRTVVALASSIEALYFAKLGRTGGQLPFRADFGLGGRFGFMQVINGTDVNDNLDDPTELHIELPFIIQLMFGENFALAPEFGVDFRIVPGSREDPGDVNPGTGFVNEIVPGEAPPPENPARNGPGFGFEITDGIGLFGGASMHYYF